MSQSHWLQKGGGPTSDVLSRSVSGLLHKISVGHQMITRQSLASTTCHTRSQLASLGRSGRRRENRELERKEGVGRLVHDPRLVLVVGWCSWPRRKTTTSAGRESCWCTGPQPGQQKRASFQSNRGPIFKLHWHIIGLEGRLNFCCCFAAAFKKHPYTTQKISTAQCFWSLFYI